MSSHLELLYCSWRSTSGFHLYIKYWTYKIILLYWKRKGIRIEKHLQCEKLLGLAGGNNKKHGNKKSGESRTPIRYNVYIITVDSQLSIARSIHLPASMSPSYMDELCIYPVLEKSSHKNPTLNIQTLYIYSLHKIHSQWTLLSPEHYPDRIDLGNQIAWKTVSEIIKLKHFTKMYMWITL